MRKIILVIVCFTISFYSFSQEKDTTNSESKDPFSLSDKLYFDGNFWASFGNQTNVNIAPKVGYKINDRLSAGIGVRYQYYSFKDYSTGYKESASFYGGSVFSRYKLIDQIFLMTEYEHMNIENFIYVPAEKWTDIWLVGAGFQYSLGGFTSAYAQVMYDVLENPLLPYFYQTIGPGVPVILRFGISFGI